MPKICSTCSREKPIEAFIKDNRRPDGYSGVCRKCGALRKSVARETRDVKYKIGDKLRSDRNRANSLKVIIEYTNLTCVHCGFNHSSTAPFDWHHTDPSTKEYSIGNLVRRATTTLLEKEMKKCLFLCKNCHALEHERLRKEKEYVTTKK